MKPTSHRLRTDSANESAAAQHSQSSQAQEFQSAEELIRADAERTPVPPSVRDRLAASTETPPAGGRSWWRRIFGKDSTSSG